MGSAQTRFVQETYSSAFQPLEDSKQGMNVLIEKNDSMSLLKYEGHEFEILEGSRHRYNRHTYIRTVSPWLLGIKDESPEKRVSEYAQWNILGSHRLDFTRDPEFGLYLPSSGNATDVYLKVEEERRDGSRHTNELPRIMVDDMVIRERLQMLLRPRYYNDVLVPFLEGRSPSWFKIPKRIFFTGNEFFQQRRFAQATKKLSSGAFVYVGCKEEVYLLAVSKMYNEEPYFQGTYLASLRPPFYFSNNYLGSISADEMKKPLWKRTWWNKDDLGINVANYRTSDPLGFNGIPFVFPQMGRTQNCKNTVFTGTPEIITGNIAEALSHFSTTDFSEYADVVEKYASTMDSEVLPQFRKTGIYYI